MSLSPPAMYTCSCRSLRYQTNWPKTKKSRKIVPALPTSQERLTQICCGEVLGKRIVPQYVMLPRTL